MKHDANILQAAVLFNVINEPHHNKTNNVVYVYPSSLRRARWLSGRASDSGARGPGFEPHDCCVVSLSKTL